MNKKEMIERHLKARGIKDPSVLKAMEKIDREKFVPQDMREHAYADTALPIGKGQTISQPYIVAFMVEKLDLRPDMTVLEIGSGCGYNAAILSQLAKQVYSLEVIEWLVHLAQRNLSNLGIQNVDVVHADGHQGLPSKAPFDRIIMTAAAPKIPEALKEQLKAGGKILAPTGDLSQKLELLEKNKQGHLQGEDILPVRFVPMTTELR